MKKNRKGASLVWAVVLCAVLFTVTATISSSIIKESNASVRMDDSSRAYAAAESGIDWGKDYVSTNGCAAYYMSPEFKVSPISPEATELVNFVVEIKPPVIVGDGCTITSLGKSNGTNRKLENKIIDANIKVFDVLDLTNIYSVPLSYTQQFDFWVGDKTTASTIDIGLKGPSANVALRYSGGPAGGYAKLVVNGTEANSGQKIIIPNTGSGGFRPDNVYAMQARIEYLRGTAIKLSIYTRTLTGRVCIGTITPYSASKVLTITEQVEGQNFTSLNQFYLGLGAGMVAKNDAKSNQWFGDATAIHNGSYVAADPNVPCCVLPGSKDSNVYLYIDNMATKGVN